MSKHWICAATLAALLMAGGTALANDVYIAQTVQGAGTGADCADALAATYFNTSSNWTAGAPSGVQIGPGTTVHVCGTLTGSAGTSGILVFQGSGSSGKPVTLKFETNASLSAPYCGVAGNNQGCLVMSTASNPLSFVTVDGGTPCGWSQATGSEGACNGTIVNTANGTTLTFQQDSQAIEADKCTNCEIKNLGISNIYVQSGGSTAADPQNQNCVGYSGSNWLIHDNKMHDIGWCIFYRMQPGDTNNQIYQNDIYNTPHPVFFATAGGISGSASNTYFYANHFHDYANWDTPSCTFHVEGIHVSGPGVPPFPTFSGLYVYNSLFDGNTGACLFMQVYLSPNTNAPGSQALVSNAAIFNNVLEWSGPGEGCVTVGGGTGNVVYNNTCVSTNADNSQGYFLNWSNISQNPGYTMTFENNAAQGTGHFVNSDHAETGITADYNAYAMCTSIGGCFNAFVPGGTSNWTSYLANTYGQEQHTHPVLNGSTCCIGSLGLNAGYVPQAGSIAIGNGANLNGICNGQPNPGLGALCSDAAGIARPSGGAWDVGAYQSSGAPPPKPNPPTNLTATPH